MLTSPPSTCRRGLIHQTRHRAICDSACRHADTPADTCTCVCKGRNHGIRHRRGMTDLFLVPHSSAVGCQFVKLNPKAA